MPDWPLAQSDGQSFQTAAISGIGIQITAGSANTKGSWVEVIAATNFDAAGFFFQIVTNGSAARYLFDVGVGANGVEQVVLSNFNLAWGDVTYGGGSAFFAVRIPKGTRVAIRSQSSTSSAVANVGLVMVSTGFGADPGFGRITTYGADTSDSGGTQVDPGASANTKGAYSVLSASTTAPIKSLIVAMNHQAAAITTSMVWLVDIAIGASTAEQVVIGDIGVRGNAVTEIMGQQIFGPIPVMIPLGSRLTARASATQTTTRNLDLVVYGID